MLIYLYSKCSTCQKALRFLEQKQIAVTVKEITQTPPSLIELEKMLAFQNGNVKKLLNTSGLLYREMNLFEKSKEMSSSEILTLLSQHGMLIKRPFLLADDFGMTGFDEKIWFQNLSADLQESKSEDNGLAALTDEDLHVYSVGVSTGGSAEIRMAKQNPNRQITATTIDLEGAQFAQTRINESGVSKQIVVKVENVSQPLPYKDHAFDFIYARLVLHYLNKNDLKQALAELHRVLKKGGKFFIVVRSSDCFEAKAKDSTYDPSTGLTTFTLLGSSYSRYFHTENSIKEYLTPLGFSISSIESYKEQLCIDFQRKILAPKIDSLIEVLCSKSN